MNGTKCKQNVSLAFWFGEVECDELSSFDAVYRYLSQAIITEDEFLLRKLFPARIPVTRVLHIHSFHRAMQQFPPTLRVHTKVHQRRR